MSGYDYDLFVIGGGSGGVRAARVAAQHGARVGIAEEHRYGGTCVIRGCVPKKLLVYAAHVRSEVRDAAGYGWCLGDVAFDWPTLVANKDKEVGRLEAIYGELLERNRVSVHRARAVFEDPHTLRVGDDRVTAGTILIACGARPFLPPVPGIEYAISSNEAFDLERLGGRIAIVGGGYIAVEFACIFQNLGPQVTLLYRGDKLLREFDDDVRTQVMHNTRELGVDVRCEAHVASIDKRGDTVRVALADGSALEVDHVMYATGRWPNTVGLGLPEAGVETGARGAVRVDDRSRTNVEHIYAVGDVTDRMALTPVAIREGQAFADTVFGGRPTRMDYQNVPTAVFSQPEAASVGLTEAAARAQLDEVEVYVSSFRPLKHTLTGAGERAMMKLIVDPASDRVVGAHMVGDGAAEIIQALAIALGAGATKAIVDATVALHPTSAEEFVLMRERREPGATAAGSG